jgi:KDO2-lipid IV(A) lauroyltransferase
MINSTRTERRARNATRSSWYRLTRLVGRVLWRSIEFLLALLVLALLLPVWMLPWKVATALGQRVGEGVYYIWPRARRVAMINMHRALSSDREEARSRTRRVMGNMGRSLAEAIQFARRYRKHDSGWEGTYRPEDPEIERRILADPRPKIFVTGHLGSWEAAASILALRFGRRGAAIVRRIDNPFLNGVVRRARLRHPSQWIEKQDGISEALRRLRQGDSIALLLDENAGPRGIFVDFFGRPASTQSSAALLALLSGAPLVVGAAFREGDGDRFVFRLEMIETETVTRESEAVETLTQSIMTVLERWIRERPDEWRWIHWRWKHRPDGSIESYSRADVENSFMPPEC